MVEFLMPSLGADMENGTILQWRVRPGDMVAKGDIVVEIETEKADMEVESFQAGTVEKILVTEGETVPVGTPLALFAAPTGAAAPAPAAAPGPQAEAVRVPAAPATVVAPPPARVAPPLPAAPPPVHVTPLARRVAERLRVDATRVPGSGPEGVVTREDIERAAARVSTVRVGPVASPRARQLAAKAGIDLRTVTGTGPGGAVTGFDIESAIALAPEGAAVPPGPGEPPAPRPRETPDRSAARQRTIAMLMERSKREIPHYYLGATIDFSRARAWLDEHNLAVPVTERMLPAALLLKAAALAVKTVPELNGRYEDGAFQGSGAVHLGVAITLRDGSLLAPAIQDAANLPLVDLMAALRDLVQRARTGKLRASEMSSGTLTVTNLGDQGVDYVHGIIFPPQVAIVGFGSIQERPWAESGMMGIRPTVVATLAADHRVSNGHRGGLYLRALTRLLQTPEEL
jgi:pyruvate dehydrogenase E2 component (dihydrolipoamide acetyltransferase)